MKKYIKYVAIIGVSLLVGLYLGLHAGNKSELIAGSVSPTGATFSTEPQAGASISNSSTTLVSLLNSSNDRYINGSYCFLENITGANSNSGSVLIQAASSSVASNIWGIGQSATNTNYIANLSLSTTSSVATNNNGFQIYYSSSTPSGTGGAAVSTSTLLWASGTYINFVANTILTNSGVCGVTFWSL